VPPGRLMPPLLLPIVIPPVLVFCPTTIVLAVMLSSSLLDRFNALCSLLPSSVIDRLFVVGTITVRPAPELTVL
jgi:hypothetical protein